MAPTICQTEELEDLDKYKGEGAFVLDVDGETGIWMPINMAKKALAASELVGELKLSHTLMSLKLDIRGERISACKEALSLSKLSQQKALEAAQIRADVIVDLEDEADSWKRKPVLWIGVGAFAIIAIEVGLYFLLSSIAIQ
jgi:hypothetical protein